MPNTNTSTILPPSPPPLRACIPSPLSCTAARPPRRAPTAEENAANTAAAANWWQTGHTFQVADESGAVTSYSLDAAVEQTHEHNAILAAVHEFSKEDGFNTDPRETCENDSVHTVRNFLILVWAQTGDQPRTCVGCFQFSPVVENDTRICFTYIPFVSVALAHQARERVDVYRHAFIFARLTSMHPARDLIFVSRAASWR